MALTTAFLNTCRALIDDLSELTAFRAALAGAVSGTRSARITAWHATYGIDNNGDSPALSLRKAIRRIVTAQAEASGALGPLDQESAYSTLAGEFVPNYPKPPSDADESKALELLLAQERLS